MNALRFAVIDAWRLLRARPLANLAVVLVLACGLAGVGIRRRRAAAAGAADRADRGAAGGLIVSGIRHYRGCR